jgi:deoxyribodipyrimidine photo-lyase
MFETEIEKILAKVETIDPIEYGKTRNFLDGAVTQLSPYISRGVISTRYVLDSLLKKGYKYYEIERLAMELAWRDYFQNVWINFDIDEDLLEPQTDVENNEMPKAVLEAATGIEAIDKGINDLYEMGYVHNHVRMYIASIATNIGKSHWNIPAKWFYYHLLDADWASNACSWQWVAGAFSKKKYYANQENINKFCDTDQSGTFLDTAYENLPEMPIPKVLKETEIPELKTVLPEVERFEIDNSKPTFIYNFYNLDPFWHKGETGVNRILLLEPSHFEKYPVSSKAIDFLLKLAENIDGIRTYVGEFDELVTEYTLSEIHFKEHPTNLHYKGNKENRDWMFPEVTDVSGSFFRYWRKCEKLLKLQINKIKKESK